MKILVRHPDGDSGDRLAMHAEKLLLRILDNSCLSIDRIEVKLKQSAGAEGRIDYRCTLSAKLLSDYSVQTDASECEKILAVYRAAHKLKFLLEKQCKSARKM
ncbi:MAG: hypothetical protein HGB21_04990 [Nitrospirae bacterium]|nr:hypothetical protein [Nitrospirota bacterium]